MKKIIVAIDSYKGTMSSKELSILIKKHLPFKDAFFTLLPMSDGGEGFVEALSFSLKSKEIKLIVEDSFGIEKQSKYIITDNHTAIMEIALSSGLTDIENSNLNPCFTSSYGLGQTMIDALDHGAKELIIGLGGSSTNDGGAGMLQALGVKFFDKEHQEIKRMTGLTISEIERIDLASLDSRLIKTNILVATDVTNPLLGKNGSAHVYSKQKGASDDMVKVLENNMKHFSDIVIKTLNIDERSFPGSGAAGGLGFALKSFLKARLESGFKLVSKMVDLEKLIESSDLVITGEGQLDTQSLNGKLPIEVAKLAKNYHKKVIGLFGQSLLNESLNLFDCIYCIVPKIATIQESLNNPKENFIKLIRTINPI